MTLGLRMGAACVVLALTLPRGPATESPPALTSVRVGVELADGTPVTDLTPEDFIITSDGEPRSVASLSAERRPLTVVLVVDVSASMGWQRVGTFVRRKSLFDSVDLGFLVRLGPLDRLRIGSIARETFLGPQFVTGRHDQREALRRALAPAGRDLYGPSPVWDAVHAAVAALAAEPGHRAVLVVTDGRSTGNRLGVSDAALAAVTAGVSVSVVAESIQPVELPQTSTTAVRVHPRMGLDWLADITGGSVLADSLLPHDDPGVLLGQLVLCLQARYEIRFEAPAGGRLRTLSVAVRRPGVTVRAPKGYAVPAPARVD